jgi:hypothetical protein
MWKRHRTTSIVTALPPLLDHPALRSVATGGFDHKVRLCRKVAASLNVSRRVVEG